jgi:hypothetical protein
MKVSLQPEPTRILEVSAEEYRRLMSGLRVLRTTALKYINPPHLTAAEKEVLAKNREKVLADANASFDMLQQMQDALKP